MSELVTEFRREAVGASAPRPSPQPSPSPSRGEGDRRAEEREACYGASLKLVGWIDEQCVMGRVHFRTRDGALLTTLDEVVRAILEDQLEVTSWPVN